MAGTSPAKTDFLKGYGSFGEGSCYRDQGCVAAAGADDRQADRQAVDFVRPEY